MNTSEQLNELAAALSKAQGKIEGAIKDSSNPFFKSTYADLASVWDAMRGPFSDNGLSVVQVTVPSDKEEVIVITRMMHASGQWIESTLALPVSKADAQGYGSALTYARRYGLSAIAGIAQVDDDGNAAAAARPAKAAEKPYTAPELAVLNVLRETALNGQDALQKAWENIGKEARVRFAKELPTLKHAAEKVSDA